MLVINLMIMNENVHSQWKGIEKIKENKYYLKKIIIIMN